MKKPNMKGIIHSIILLVDSVRGSIEGMAVIFCCAHMEAPTSTGMRTVIRKPCLLTSRPRSSPRNDRFRGTSVSTKGSHGYRRCERRASASGLVGSNEMIDWYSPIQMGNWITIGPRHPIGLTPASFIIRICA